MAPRAVVPRSSLFSVIGAAGFVIDVWAPHSACGRFLSELSSVALLAMVAELLGSMGSLRQSPCAVFRVGSLRPQVMFIANDWQTGRLLSVVMSHHGWRFPPSAIHAPVSHSVSLPDARALGSSVRGLQVESDPKRESAFSDACRYISAIAQLVQHIESARSATRLHGWPSAALHAVDPERNGETCSWLQVARRASHGQPHLQLEEINLDTSDLPYIDP